MEIEFLEALEERVRAASRRLAELKEENRTLALRVRDLEERLEEEGGDSGSAWTREREEVRRRVEALTNTLEELLSE